MALAQLLCDEFLALGHWADYIDPCSGLPVSFYHCTYKSGYLHVYLSVNLSLCLFKCLFLRLHITDFA